MNPINYTRLIIRFQVSKLPPLAVPILPRSIIRENIPRIQIILFLYSPLPLLFIDPKLVIISSILHWITFTRNSEITLERQQRITFTKRNSAIFSHETIISTPVIHRGGNNFPNIAGYDSRSICAANVDCHCTLEIAEWLQVKQRHRAKRACKLY